MPNAYPPPRTKRKPGSERRRKMADSDSETSPSSSSTSSAESSSGRNGKRKALPMPPASVSLKSSSSSEAQTTSVADGSSSSGGGGGSSSSRSGSSGSDNSNEMNVRVVARLRPLSTKELNEQSKESITTTKAQSGTIQVEDSRKFSFDAVFGPDTSQSKVYQLTAGDTVQRNIFKGFNVTILAYGQTGSGKTFTMGTDGGGGGSSTLASTGNDENIDAANVPPPPPPRSSKARAATATKLAPPSDGDGIIPRAVHDLFKTRSRIKDGEERVKVEMSYLEIYNEEARDLLATGDPKKASDLFIRDSKTEGVIVQGLSRHAVQSPTDVSDLMQSASLRRVTASTNMNAVSSRSHAICTLHVTIAPLCAQDADDDDDDDDEADKEISAKLTLVDLAGSERIKRTKAEGARMKEGININKGLFVLGQVVSALSELGQQQSTSSKQSGSSSSAHIPYRDSKLTRLLQDSLGGNSKTVMVACVSPADSNIDESVNTLRYAERARNIKNAAVQNVVSTAMSPTEAAALRRENQMLKLQLLQAQMQLSASASVSGAHNVKTVGEAASLALKPEANDEMQNLRGINMEKLEIVTRLRANVTSLRSKINQLEGKNEQCVEDSLTASLKADKWQLKAESLIATLKAKGIPVPEEIQNGIKDEGLAEQLRKEISGLKQELEESRTDAEVARATAAAVVAGEGDLTAAEQMALADEVGVSGHGGDEGKNDRDATNNDSGELSAELVAVSGEIEQKEAMAAQMNKERECMDTLKSHFEDAVKRLQEEVDVLSSERDALIGKVEISSASTSAGKKRSSSSINGELEDNPERKKMRERIKELELRIKGLKIKVSEHAKSLRRREIAEKKCIQLAAEIAEDKKRRASLQRQLKEAAFERRSEKKAAQQQAARLLRDSNKMKNELNKVKEAAARQAAVLRRKAAEALSKQKLLAEQQKKRSSAAALRAGRSSSSSVPVQRRDEVMAWLERELNSASTLKDIRDQIEEHTLLLQEASLKKEDLLARKGARNDSIASALRAVESEIETRTSVVQQLEANCEEVHKSVLGNKGRVPSSSSCFIDSACWQGLSRTEVRLVTTNTFERLVQATNEARQKDESHKSAVQKAVSEERRKAQDTIMKLKMEHSEATMTLLESTKGAMEHKVRDNLLTATGETGLEPSVQSAIDEMLSEYLSGCTKVGQTLKGELEDVRAKHDGMKKFVDDVAKGLIAKNEAASVQSTKKKKKKPKAKTSPSDIEDDFDLFEDDDAGAVDDSDDSDWTDTPARKKRSSGRSRKKVTQPERKSVSDDEGLAGESIIHRQDGDEGSNFEAMTVAQLKEVLKKEGKTVSGKKADLIKRLRSQQTATEEIETDDTKENPKPRASTPEPGIRPASNQTSGERKPLGRKASANRRNTPPSSGAKVDSSASVAFKPATPKQAGERTQRRIPSSRLKRQSSAPALMTQSAKKRRRRLRSSMAEAVNKAAKAAEAAHAS